MNVFTFFTRAMFPSTQSKTNQKFVRITPVSIHPKLSILSNTAATKITIQDKTDTIFAVQPALINKYVTGNDAFLTHNCTHKELRLFFFLVSDDFMSSKVYLIIFLISYCFIFTFGLSHTTIAFSGTSNETTALAPIFALLPIWHFPTILQPAYNVTLSPITGALYLLIPSSPIVTC